MFADHAVNPKYLTRNQPFICSFLTSLGGSVAIFGLTFRCVDLKATPLELGLLGTAFLGAYACSAGVSSRIRKGLGERLMLAVLPVSGLILLAPLGLEWSPRYQILRLGLYGLATGFFWPTLYGYVARIRIRGGLFEATGRFNLSWGIAGCLLGPALSGILYEQGIIWPFVFAMGCLLVVLLLVLLIPPPPEIDEKSAHPETAHVKPYVARAFLYILRMAGFVAFFCIGGANFLFPKLASIRGISPKSVGMLFFISGLGVVGLLLLMKRTRFWHYAIWPVLAVQGGLILAMLMLGFADRWIWTVAAMILVGVARGVIAHSSIYYSLAAPGDRAKSGGVNEVFLASGNFAGPVIGGLFASVTGSLSVAFALGAVVILIGIFHQLIIHHYVRNME